MTATFTIEGELSERGLLEAKVAIEGLLTGEDATLGAHNPDPVELALAKARLLRQWSGDATWHFMATIAQCYQAEQEFTFDDLSETFSVDKETVKSWHRSASKIMNKVNKEYGEVPAFLIPRWDGERQHYRMPGVTCAAMIEAAS